MAKERRILRLQQLILEVVSETLLREVRDPRIGMPTVTRVQLATDLSRATIFWSCLQEGGARRRTSAAMESALPLLQRRVAGAMHTRVTPTLSLHFDRSLEHAQRLDEIFHHLAEERGETPGNEEAEGPEVTDPRG